MLFDFCTKKREGVGTSKITSSKGQNVESFFKDDQNVKRSERRKSEHQKERQKCKNDFRRSDLS
jgi:hypothetical protein